MSEHEDSLRAAIVATCRWMAASGLTGGTSGNVSARLGSRLGSRLGARMLITPSAVAYEALEPAMIAAMPLDGGDGGDGAWDGPLPPSTEWRMHRDILLARPAAGAVLHAHPPHATALAICRRDIPAAHYMVAAFGGDDVRCSAYATFGTAALSRAALAALEGRDACLLANHGIVAVGADLGRARWLAGELETLAQQYWLSLQAGGPVLLDAAEIAEARAAFAGYGRGPAGGGQG